MVVGLPLFVITILMAMNKVLLTFKYNRKGELMWDVVYRNDFANGNVAGYLSDEEVLELLEWIKSLEK